ncbi:amino acid--tRNA ligase-related protein [Bradyrhizobium sp.]
MPKNPCSDTPNWRKPLPNGVTRADILAKRHLMRRAIRGWLDDRGFLEIDAPLLVHGTTPDSSIESFAVGDRYLVTSTEFQLKRLFADGFEQLYTLTQNFRLGDLGALNNPEFTMLEWARVGANLETIETDAEQLVLVAARSIGIGETLAYQGTGIDLRAPWPRMTVKDAISKATGTIIPDFALATLQKAAAACGLNASTSLLEDDASLFSALMSHVQNELGFDKPVFLRDWPVFQASSAPIRSGEACAERSELIIGGIELSDGFPFLIEYESQRRANDEQLALRRSAQAPLVELDDRFLSAIRDGLPPGAGMALGLDRLVMVLTDQPAIRPVLAFAWDEV